MHLNPIDGWISEVNGVVNIFHAYKVLWATSGCSIIQTVFSSPRSVNKILAALASSVHEL